MTGEIVAVSTAERHDRNLRRRMRDFVETRPTFLLALQTAGVTHSTLDTKLATKCHLPGCQKDHVTHSLVEYNTLY